MRKDEMETQAVRQATAPLSPEVSDAARAAVDTARTGRAVVKSSGALQVPPPWQLEGGFTRRGRAAPARVNTKGARGR